MIERYKIFVSHGSHDLWLAEQIAKIINDTGALVFLDEKSIPKGHDFKKIIHQEIKESNELVILFTPWSYKRSWIWVEMGAAWIQDIPIVAIFYGIKPSDLEKNGQGKGILENINIVQLNEFDNYIKELTPRVGEVFL